MNNYDFDPSNPDSYREDSNRKYSDAIPYITTWRNKNKSNKKMAKNLAMFYMDYHDRDYLSERQAKIEENADLYNGRWRRLEDIYNNGKGTVSIGGESISTDGPKLRHYPVIDRVARAAVAENAMRPLKPIVVDHSSKSVNERKRRKLKEIGEFLEESFVAPLRRDIIQRIRTQEGLGPNEPMNQEQEQTVAEQIEARTPEEVKESLEEFTTKDEQIMQKFLDYCLSKYDIKNKLDVGYENAVQHGEEFYRLHVHNDNDILFEELNPKYVVWGGSEHTEFVEDGEFAKYEQFLAPNEVLKRYGKHLKRSQLDRIQRLYGPFPSGNRSNKNPDPNPSIEKRLLETVARNPKMQEGIDARTREGQNRLLDMYKYIEPRHGRAVYGIRETYITFKWGRKMKVVTTNEDGFVKDLIVDEDYEFSPLNGDISIKDIFVDEAWHAVVLGEDEFVFCEPLPYQNKSLEDPFGAKLSIYGCTYNTLMNNSKNMSLIDNGKPWQYKYNLQVRRLEEYEETNIGKVMVGTHKMRPPGFTWQEFYKSGRYLKFLPINVSAEHIQSDDLRNLFKSVDMSNNIDIAAALQQLDSYETKIITSMYSNPSKLGEPSPYLTSGNNNSNIQASDKQMYRYFQRHKEMTERVLNGFINIARVAFKDSELKKSVLLDDFSRASLEIDNEVFKNSEIGIFVVNDFFENQKIDFLRQQLLPFIQNRYGSMKDFIRIINAKSMNEMIEIAEKAERKAEQQEQARHQNTLKEIEQKSLQDKDLMDYKNSLEMMREQAKQEFLKVMKEMDVTKFARQFDIDEDGINDMLTKSEMDNKRHIEVAKIKAEVDKYKADKNHSSTISKLRKLRKSG